VTRPPTYIFEADRTIGTVVEVHPGRAVVNLPLAAADEPQLRYGERVGAGEVGEFVIVECGDIGLFGRLSTVRLPERDRLSVDPPIGARPEPHPLGTVELLCSIPVTDGSPVRGIERSPRIGARVYSLDPELIGWIAEHAGGDEPRPSLRVSLAHLPESAGTSVRITPERLFGRHCAVLGATGSGKSWTVARIVERCTEFNAKVLLLDATGEYHRLSSGVRHVSLGNQLDRPAGTHAVSLPYHALVEDDLFALFRPTGQSQLPKLREAMKSLKLARVLGEGGLVANGCIVKAGREKAPFFEAYSQHAKVLDAPFADFDISLLPEQLQNECVWPSAREFEGGHACWGATDNQAYTYCATLIARIAGYLNLPEFQPVLSPGETPSIFDEIEAWLQDDEHPVLRVSLRHLAFTADVREIVANGIGRRILDRARKGRFEDLPLVLCLDEAHQFMNKLLGDEYSRYPLDAFDLIAKEGRKYSLSLCLATQRPRDLPEAVLGQMGTLLVHRLTNDADRRLVERASGDLDQSAAAFLPTLSPGQALLLGVDYPIPLIIKVTPPSAEPDSSGPDFQRHWQVREGTEAADGDNTNGATNVTGGATTSGDGEEQVATDAG
jgi:uncharacterized protein